MKTNLKFPQSLAKARREAGFTQAEVAEILGLSTGQFIGNWERGITRPPMFQLREMARIYKTPAAKLFDILVEDVEAGLETQYRRKTAGDRRPKSRKA